MQIEKVNYELIYIAPLCEVNLEEILLVSKSNVDKPRIPIVPSLNISDIIVIQKEQKIHSFYVDVPKFIQISEFTDECNNKLQHFKNHKFKNWGKYSEKY